MPEQMGTTRPADALSGAGRDVVTLRLPAAGAYLSVLRTATASLASRRTTPIPAPDLISAAFESPGSG